MKKIYRAIRKVIIAVVGSVVVILGIILIPLPGPGILVTVAGLAILSLEFEWAERHLQNFKKKLRAVIEKSRPKS